MGDWQNLTQAAGGGGGGGGGYLTLSIVSSAITPVAAAQETQAVLLTQSITVNAPSGTPAQGDILRLHFTQDGTGGWALTWNTAWKVGAIGALLGDAWTYSTFDFVYVGSGAWRLTSLPAIGLPI